MACLMDFMSVMSSDAQKKKTSASPEFKEWEELLGRCDMMLERGYFTGNRDRLSNPEKVILKQEKRLLDTIWKKYQFVPFAMSESALGYRRTGNYADKINHYDNKIAYELHCYAGTPQVKLAEIREAAMKLSYMILPVCYVNRSLVNSILEKELLSESYIHDSCVVSGIERAENRLVTIAEFTEQDLYILCPVSFYDLCQAEKDEEPCEVIFGGELMRVKALLDTITQIQRNLFATLDGDEGDTDAWEIGEGGGCSESELLHLKILVETIMPIQHSLLEVARKSKDMDAWQKTMQGNHSKEMAEVLRKMAKELSWSEEAIEALKQARAQEIKDAKKAAWVLPEAAAIPDVLIFAVPRGTSVVHGKGWARVMGAYSMDMPESFYLNRGFSKPNKKVEFEVEQMELSM